MYALLFWVILGGLAGGFVKSIAWYESERGWLACVALGIVGGVAGGYLSVRAGAGNGFELSSMGACILGAAVLLTVYKLAVRSAPQSATLRRAA